MPHDITSEDIERRFSYHSPNPEKAVFHEDVRTAFKEFAERLRQDLPAGREKSLVFTALEEAGFWAHAALARDISE